MFGFLKCLSCFGAEPVPMPILDLMYLPGPSDEEIEKEVDDVIQSTMDQVRLERHEKEIKKMIEILSLPSPPKTIVTRRH